ncbi:recombinase family protein [Lactiplantibacillus songbeiensis]|uniref:Recombinase family protein n=1 Tax=Lactiplantibacillus songbeiensis TaxID=2559920 RepID=A0ABW4C4H8_9LACO|nr:recombinase family protein [Lactiplantibacillus songbeiensis]
MQQIIIGYARVSTAENRQELGLELQLRALKDNACDVIFSDQLSGSNDQRPEFNQAVTLAKKKAAAGWQVKFMVYKLDRLSRRTVKMITTIDDLTQHQVQVISLCEQLDMSTPTGILQYQILATFSEYELNTIRQRTRDALAELKKHGQKLGRPRLATDVEQRICQLYQISDYPVKMIAKECRVAVSTIYNVAKRNQLSRRKSALTNR